MSDFTTAAAYEAAITVQTFARLIALDLATGKAVNHLEQDCLSEWAIAAEAFLAHSYPVTRHFHRAQIRRELGDKVPA